MYQATDSRQRRRQRQKGSSSVSGNKKDEGRECAPAVPAKSIFVMPQCEIPRDTLSYREFVKSATCKNIVTDHPFSYYVKHIYMTIYM